MGVVAILQLYTLRLRCIRPGTVAAHGGYHLHALLFRLWATVAPGWTEAVHAAAQKPFSLAVASEGARGRAPGALAEGMALVAQVGTLTGEATRHTAALQALAGTAHPLGTAGVRLEEVVLAYPPPGIRVADLALPEPASRRLHLEFLTPCSFRRQGQQIPFPLPELVFGSLLRRYNAFSSPPLPETWAESCAEIRVAQYRLQTVTVEFPEYKIIGAVGNATYELPPAWPASLVRAAWALARYAAFAGVGYKTSMGMGQVRLAAGNRTPWGGRAWSRRQVTPS